MLVLNEEKILELEEMLVELKEKLNKLLCKLLQINVANNATNIYIR